MPLQPAGIAVNGQMLRMFADTSLRRLLKKFFIGSLREGLKPGCTSHMDSHSYQDTMSESFS